MALIAEFTTPRDTFAAGQALAGTDGLTVELERIIPTGETVVPYLWVWGDDLQTYEENLESIANPDSVHVIERTDRGALYRLDWRDQMSATIRDLFDLDFTLLSGVATTSGWEFELRFPHGEAASEFKSFLNERAIPHDLRRLHRLSAIPREVTELTDEQREALLVAYHCGYFNEPRDVTLSEIADELDISPSSVSGRLRRGYEVLVETAILSELRGRNGHTNGTELQRI